MVRKNTEERVVRSEGLSAVGVGHISVHAISSPVDVHVAVNAPASSPRVSEDEVISFHDVANDVNSVVQSNLAFSIEHTASVPLEDFVSAHGNRYDILRQGGDQSSLGTIHLLEARDLIMLILRSAATRAACLVRIVR